MNMRIGANLKSLPIFTIVNILVMVIVRLPNIGFISFKFVDSSYLTMFKSKNSPPTSKLNDRKSVDSNTIRARKAICLKECITTPYDFASTFMLGILDGMQDNDAVLLAIAKDQIYTLASNHQGEILSEYTISLKNLTEMLTVVKLAVEGLLIYKLDNEIIAKYSLTSIVRPGNYVVNSKYASDKLVLVKDPNYVVGPDVTTGSIINLMNDIISQTATSYCLSGETYDLYDSEIVARYEMRHLGHTFAFPNTRFFLYQKVLMMCSPVFHARIVKDEVAEYETFALYMANLKSNDRLIREENLTSEVLLVVNTLIAVCINAEVVSVFPFYVVRGLKKIIGVYLAHQIDDFSVTEDDPDVLKTYMFVHELHKKYNTKYASLLNTFSRQLSAVGIREGVVALYSVLTDLKMTKLTF